MVNITTPKCQSNNTAKLLNKEISHLIDEAKNRLAFEYNATQTLLCWLIGNCINSEIIKSDRAEYGKMVVNRLAEMLSVKYGRGYSRANLFRMIKFVKLFPKKAIVSTLSRQLSWSHFVIICTIEEQEKREFYTEMSRIQSWSVRGLQKQVNSMLYERTALSKKPEKVIKAQLEHLKASDKITADMTFKEPYFLDFINAHPSLSEEELENLILNHITEFLQELGNDFCLVARQKRMSTTKKDRYLDLLFFNRRLRQLIAIDLKIGNFDPSYKGQMEWYLNWLNKNERFNYEKKPMGIILCAGKDHDDIEYCEMDKSGIHVAQYITALPSKETLELHLRKAITTAKENFIKKTLITKSEEIVN